MTMPPNTMTNAAINRASGDIAIAGLGDNRAEYGWRDARSTCGGADRDRRRDDGPQTAIESPFSGKRAAAIGGVPRVYTGPAMGERPQRGRGRELATNDGEMQTITGHRIDETGGVAGEQQSVDRIGGDVDGKRTEHDRRH